MIGFTKNIVLISTLIFVSAGCTKPTHQTNMNQQILQPSFKTNMVIINGSEIEIEVANTAALQQQGLSGRRKLDDNTGMLFDFVATNTVGQKHFWMIDMQFNLDIIWIRNNKIIGIDKNVPSPLPNTSPEKLPRYPSPGSIEYALEVNAGWSDEHKIEVGDTVTLDYQMK